MHFHCNQSSYHPHSLTVARNIIILVQDKMSPSIPSSQALFVTFLFATTFLWTFPENVVATSKHGSVTRHYKFDVRSIILFFLHIYQPKCQPI